ncbi:hypothetical protein BDZ45DRAFT_667884, partial [Acephala macrosclerotiorum]
MPAALHLGNKRHAKPSEKGLPRRISPRAIYPVCKARQSVGDLHLGAGCNVEIWGVTRLFLRQVCSATC